MYATKYATTWMVFLVFFFSMVFPFANVAAKGETITELNLSPQKCNKDPSRGKLGPIGNPPPRTCVKGGVLKEGSQDRFFDADVMIDDIGKVTLCNTPIPLGENCEPVRVAILRYCDNVLNHASSGAHKCIKGVRDPNSKISESVAGMTKYLSSPPNRHDYVARGLLEASRTSLDYSVFKPSISDRAGILIPLEQVEQRLAKSNYERTIEGPINVLRAIAQGIDPSDSTRLEQAIKIVQTAEQKDVDPWVFIPRLESDMGGARFPSEGSILYSYDTGVAIKYYPKEQTTFTGLEIQPPQTDSGMRILNSAVYIPPTDYSDIPPSMNIYQNPPSPTILSQSVQMMQRAYTSVQIALQNSLSTMLLWLRN
jgi:hypothetical protein